MIKIISKIGLKSIAFILIYTLLACNANSENNSDSSNNSINNSSSSERNSKKCSDMDSYDYGYAVAKDQDGLLADCDYLYDIAITQKYIENKSCFCSGVTDYRNNK
jgi:hypothetical protein